MSRKRRNGSWQALFDAMTICLHVELAKKRAVGKEGREMGSKAHMEGRRTVEGARGGLKEAFSSLTCSACIARRN